MKAREEIPGLFYFDHKCPQLVLIKDTDVPEKIWKMRQFNRGRALHKDDETNKEG